MIRLILFSTIIIATIECIMEEDVVVEVATPDVVQSEVEALLLSWQWKESIATIRDDAATDGDVPHISMVEEDDSCDDYFSLPSKSSSESAVNYCIATMGATESSSSMHIANGTMTYSIRIDTLKKTNGNYHGTDDHSVVDSPPSPR